MMQQIASEWVPYCATISRLDPVQLAKDSLSWQRCQEQWTELTKHLPANMHNPHLLEIGSGYGLFVAYLLLYQQVDAWGVEPGTDIYSSRRLAQDVLAFLGIDPRRFTCAVGEALPFADATFDIIYNTNVLEHVKDPSYVLAESLRVLKPGGVLQCVIPSYGSWWEGHYGVLWLPHMPKWLAKIYVRFYGRDPRFIDTLQFITRPWLERILDAHSENIEILGWGVDIWEKRVRSLGFSDWAALGTLKKMVRLIHKAGMVEPVIWVGKRLHWETPIILTLRKIK